MRRVDYAVNIQTPYVKEYLNLFYKGALPKKFAENEKYESSYYVKSEMCRINFYDKIEELKTKNNVTSEHIINELKMIPKGLLRLEIQCMKKKVIKLKEKYGLSDVTVKSFWNRKIADEIIHEYVTQIIGKENIFKFDDCIEKLEKVYEYRTMSQCRRLMDLLIKNPDFNLKRLKLKEVNQLVYKMRQVGINPIPLEAIYSGEEIEILENPYKLIKII